MKQIKTLYFNSTRRVGRFLAKKIMGVLYETPVIIGTSGKLLTGNRVALANTLFNLSSGNIKINDRVIFSHGCMVVTGRHEFMNGMRASLNPGMDDGSWGGGEIEVPQNGFDIEIGSGCFIGVGSIILGGVTIGKNCIVAPGAIVTKSFPDFSVVGGIPAKTIGSTFSKTPGRLKKLERELSKQIKLSPKN